MHSTFAQLTPTPQGLTLTGVLLAKRISNGSIPIEGHLEDVLALLSAAYGREVPASVLGYIERAGKLMAEVSEEDLEWMHAPLHMRPAHAKPTEARPAIANAINYEYGVGET